MKYREFDDVEGMRRNILDKVREATASRYPVENDRFILELDELEYDTEAPASLKEQKKAIMEGGSLSHKLKGHWVLRDKATGEVVDEKRTIVAHVPMATQRGTFVFNGNEYTCLHPSAKIWTEDGMIPIGDIVDQRLNVRVWSWNFQEQRLELKPIVNWFENEANDKLVCAHFEAPGRFSTVSPRFSPTTLWGTKDHGLYDKDGNKTDLVESRTITVVQEKLSESQVRQDNDIQYELREVSCEIEQDSDKVFASRRTVYDIEVADNHNYFANGVLVSNCNSQLRLRSGPYSRKKDNGGLETHFNMLPGSGSPAFRVHLEPETGIFKMQLGQSHLPMYPILHALGVPDERIEQAWGKELFAANRREDPAAVRKAYERFVRDRQPDEAPEVGLRRTFSSMQMDEEIVNANLGRYLPQQNLSDVGTSPLPSLANLGAPNVKIPGGTPL